MSYLTPQLHYCFAHWEFNGGENQNVLISSYAPWKRHFKLFLWYLEAHARVPFKVCEEIQICGVSTSPVFHLASHSVLMSSCVLETGSRKRWASSSLLGSVCTQPQVRVKNWVFYVDSKDCISALLKPACNCSQVLFTVSHVKNSPGRILMVLKPLCLLSDVSSLLSFLSPFHPVLPLTYLRRLHLGNHGY